MPASNCPAMVPTTNTAYGIMDPPGPGRSLPFRVTNNHPSDTSAEATAPATGEPSSTLELNTNTASTSPDNATIPRYPSRFAPVTFPALAATKAATAPEILNAGKLETADAM